MKGVFIPEEFFKIEELNYTEMMVLALYKYYTEQGKYKCCSLTNQDICNKFRMSERNLQMIKKHLKELGMIRSDGGIKVKFLGIKMGEADCTPKVKDSSSGGEADSIKGVKNTAVLGEVDCTHNKEEKRNKEIKKEGMTNFDLVIDSLPMEYKTQERIDFLYKEVSDKIDNFNSIEEVNDYVIDSAVKQIKCLLLSKFPITYKIEAQEEVKEEKKDYSWDDFVL